MTATGAPGASNRPVTRSSQVIGARQSASTYARTSDSRGAARRFARDHQTLHRLVNHRDAGNAARDRARLIGAGVVDDEDSIGGTGLRLEGVQTTGNEARLVVGADDDRNRHLP